MNFRYLSSVSSTRTSCFIFPEKPTFFTTVDATPLRRLEPSRLCATVFPQARSASAIIFVVEPFRSFPLPSWQAEDTPPFSDNPETALIQAFPESCSHYSALPFLQGICFFLSVFLKTFSKYQSLCFQLVFWAIKYNNTYSAELHYFF